jgi:hypothetical protein
LSSRDFIIFKIIVSVLLAQINALLALDHLQIALLAGEIASETHVIAEMEPMTMEYLSFANNVLSNVAHVPSRRIIALLV